MTRTSQLNIVHHITDSVGGIMLAHVTRRFRVHVAYFNNELGNPIFLSSCHDEIKNEKYALSSLYF